MTDDDLDDDETELAVNWLKLTDGQREEAPADRDGIHHARDSARARSGQTSALNTFPRV
jgi:hypothetical protein